MSQFQEINPNVAGIDLGSEALFVYAWQAQELRSFSSFTESLLELSNWLVSLGVKSVAMESTGVLWLPVFEALELAGLEVVLVNAWHVKNVPGKKSDVSDCQWIAQLHCYGLLGSSFVPDADIRHLRALMRLRRSHVQQKAAELQRAQKALELMNLKLHEVISDIGGVSGMAIIRHIVAGERDAEKLAQLCVPRILKHKRKRVIASLQGQYHPAHIFALKQAVDTIDFYFVKIKECDQQLEALLQNLTKDQPKPIITQAPKKRTKRNSPQIDDLHTRLITLTYGNDPTSIPGISEHNLLELIAELGLSLEPWPTEKHFVSWLGLAPMTRQSGKSKKNARLKKNTRAGQIFRQAAESVASGKFLALTAFYKRIKAKKGAKVANKATARKIALMYYRVLKYGLDYVEQGIEKYNQVYKEKQLKYLQKKAKELNYNIVAME